MRDRGRDRERAREDESQGETARPDTRAQVEEGLRALGFDRLVIYRPGVLCNGDR